MVKGIRRTLLVARKQALPLLPEAPGRISAALPDDLSGTRDRALLVSLGQEELSFGDDAWRLRSAARRPIRGATDARWASRSAQAR